MNRFSKLVEFSHDALNHETRQQWVQLLHMGSNTGRDGRSHPVSSFDNILASFKHGGVDLVVDYEHETAGENASAAPAAGWIKQLETRGEGLYGLIEWTERAFAMVRDKEYRYISPVYRVKSATNEVLKIESVGLTHYPNFVQNSLNRQQQESAMHVNENEGNAPQENIASVLKDVAQLLGLEPKSDLMAIKAAIFNLREELQKAREAALKGEEAISQNRVKVLQNAYEEQSFNKEFERVFDEGVSAGKLLPFTKAYHYSACRMMSSVDHLEQHIKMAPAIFPTDKSKMISNQNPDRASRFGGMQEDVARSMGIDPGRL